MKRVNLSVHMVHIVHNVHVVHPLRGEWQVFRLFSPREPL